MNEVLRRDAEAVVRAAIDAVRPDAAVRRALARIALAEDLYLAAVGKAGWQMASAAVRYLDSISTRTGNSFIRCTKVL